MLILRTIGLWFNYVKHRFWLRRIVRFKGFSIICKFPKSELIFVKGGIKTCINSHPLSNLVGLSQRTIIIARYGGKISIGAGCGISGSTIYAMKEINIGDNVLIGGNCKIIDNDFHPLPASQRLNQKVEDINKRPINIGAGCFIGANSIILKGTTLGKNVVVGAGSVVSGTFPDNVIIAGNPARIVKENKV